MNIETIRIKSPVSDENELGFVVINKVDFDPELHEPFDDESRAALASAITSGEIVPSMPELLAARDALQARERELNDKAAALAEQAAANEAEAQRLADEAAAQSAAAPKKPSIAELRDQLTAKQIAFDPAASKADLQALLDNAPAA